MCPIFISYCRDDIEFTKRLVGNLRQNGLMLWIDIEKIPAGVNWSGEVQKALDTCHLMILIVTPKSMESKRRRDYVRAQPRHNLV